MASVERYVTPRGVPVIRVRWQRRTPTKIVRQSMTFTEDDDAQRFIRMLDVFDGDGDKATAAVGGSKMAVMTVRQVMLSYVDANPRAAAAQRAKYRHQIRDHFDDALGHTPINDVDVDVVQAWVGRMLGKQQGKANPRVRTTPVRPIRAKIAPVQVHSLAPKTIRNLHGLLSASMEWAVQRHLRADNPCKGVLLPKIETVGDEMCLLSHQEFDLLHDAMSPRYQLLLRTMVASGLRWGEITALQVKDLVIGDNMATLRVNKAWKRNDQFSHYIGSTKTSRSRRTVSVGATLAVELAEFTRGEPAGQLLFTNRNGGQIRHSTFWESTWARAVNAARNPTGPNGEPDLDAPRLTKQPRIHDLRHTHASWMIAAGCDLVVLQRRLGHESITTTVDRYSHLMPQQHVRSAVVAEAAVSAPRD